MRGGKKMSDVRAGFRGCQAFRAILTLVWLLAAAGCGGGNSSTSAPAADTGALPPDTSNGSGGVVAVGEWNPDAFDYVYDVGPGREYSDPGQIPWEDLEPSTLVRIHYRDEPYCTKWVMTTTATAEKPLVVLGVADNGRLPVISGEDAVTRSSLYYLNEPRSVVKIGNYTGADDTQRPAYIYLQNLEIRSGRPAYTFTDRSGSIETYSTNAAAVHIEEGDHITIQGCTLDDCGNGLFNSHLTSAILIRQNHIYGNGIENSIYEHNSYTESRGIVFEFNHYGPLRAGCLGNNLKDRSSGTVIRYNWIESGNRQLDLVETDYADIADDPAYDATFVYGNILIEPDNAGNSQILHYGGDGGDTSMYRQGTLYFYQNTVVSTRSGNTTLLRLSTTQVHAQVCNNILAATAGGQYLAITSGNGQTVLSGNWLPVGWRQTHEADLEPGATVTDLGNVEGTDPGFVALDAQDFHLAADADARDAAGELPGAVADYLPDEQYGIHQQAEDRPVDGNPDIGAFEFAAP
jgi:hypothetical protein